MSNERYLQCTTDSGEKLTGYHVSSGEHWWVWARDDDDARVLAALSYIGEPFKDVTYEKAATLYKDAIDEDIADMWVEPLTEADSGLRSLIFADERDDTKHTAYEAMQLTKKRGVVASTSDLPPSSVVAAAALTEDGDAHQKEDMHPNIKQLLKWFEYQQLPPRLQTVSAPFHDLAHALADTIKGSPELTVALRKLLESKDAAVRAALLQ